MSRMFHEVARTWSPITGCAGHACCYCWARDLALGRLKNSPKYKKLGFELQLHRKELERRFHGGLIFVSAMGDMWCQKTPAAWISQVLETVRHSPEVTFLMLTKNPERYRTFIWAIPHNVILGATIETDRYPRESICYAPSPAARAEALAAIRRRRKFLSIEPVLKFDHDALVSMVKRVKPEFVYIGNDNHNWHLPEPSLKETRALIRELKHFTEVRTKNLRERWDA